MQEEATTPMLKQYLAIKKQYTDCLLFYRMGDFYELFMDDAHIGAKVLNITLTGKANGKNGRIPMAGVPYHAVDSYLAKLVKAGYKVAICEQLSPPNKKGLVKRDVVRIVTPGTLLDEKALDKKENNYIISICVKGKNLAFSVADISTGYFATTECTAVDIEQTIKDELARMHPTECILPESLYNDAAILHVLKTERDLNIFPYQSWDVYADSAKKQLQTHFGVATLAGFGIDDKPLALQTASALLGYLQETQKTTVAHIKKITLLERDKSLLLDRSTILNLELFSTIREHDSKGTVLSVLDQTITAMGGRLLKQWLRKPLTDKKTILRRHDIVEFFVTKREERQKLRDTIEEINDVERLLSRMSVGLGNGRDLVNLSLSLKTMIAVKAKLSSFEKTVLKDITKEIDSKAIQKIISLLDTHIVPEPPISIREGKFIQSGVNAELDKLRSIVGGSRDWILEMEKNEKAATGIATLKVRFNKVFGFYIEISKSNAHLAPSHYMRKQTLVNGERFITKELKEQEDIILTAEQRINDLEYMLFQEIVEKVLQEISLLQDAAESIAHIDCLLTFAHNAEKHNYVRATLLDSGEISITHGRHPVVETLIDNKQFVPNDVYLDNKQQQLLLITGPNMAGKSVFIRQVALLILMNQIGSFVPADKADISLVDRIFVRSGASDVITSGLSTFMVEMVETANILHYATNNSLIVMDEIGRGTSTYDGISIAWAVAEHLVTTKGIAPKTLFATHYHELQLLEEHYPNSIKNFHMAVAEDKGEPVFLHTILPGGASHSFGVAVAKLAGLPKSVIERAHILLQDLEKRATNNVILNKSEESQNDILINEFIVKEFEKMDIHHMTPIEALNTLSALKNTVRSFTINAKGNILKGKLS